MTPNLDFETSSSIRSYKSTVAGVAHQPSPVAIWLQQHSQDSRMASVGSHVWSRNATRLGEKGSRLAVGSLCSSHMCGGDTLCVVHFCFVWCTSACGCLCCVMQAAAPIPGQCKQSAAFPAFMISPCCRQQQQWALGPSKQRLPHTQNVWTHSAPFAHLTSHTSLGSSTCVVVPTLPCKAAEAPAPCKQQQPLTPSNTPCRHALDPKHSNLPRLHAP